MSNLVKLLFISGDANHNKYYDMTKSDDGSTFSVKFGRVGATSQTASYPMKDWNKKYNEKIKKGYKDVTSILTEIKAQSTVKISDEKAVEELILKLQEFANSQISKTYLVDSSQVTKAQLELAQEILDKLTKSFNKYFGKKEWDVKIFNKELEELYSTIPRKMKKVQHHLITNDSTKDEISQLMGAEQDNLDSMTSQYNSTNANTIINDNQDNNVNLLAQLNLEISSNLTSDEKSWIEKMMGDNKRQINKIFKVKNLVTEKNSIEHLDTMKNKRKEYYFHGSRNQNFWFILQQGLKIRPSNAIYSGSMFGDGIYGANKAQKSIGYTSLSGSYWAHGSANVAYLAIFEFLVGNMKDIHKHNYECYSLSYSKIQKDGYDSVFAHKGADLRNDEIIIYNSNQCTIKYLIEIKN